MHHINYDELFDGQFRDERGTFAKDTQRAIKRVVVALRKRLTGEEMMHTQSQSRPKNKKFIQFCSQCGSLPVGEVKGQLEKLCNQVDVLLPNTCVICYCLLEVDGNVAGQTSGEVEGQDAVKENCKKMGQESEQSGPTGPSGQTVDDQSVIDNVKQSKTCRENSQESERSKADAKKKSINKSLPRKSGRVRKKGSKYGDWITNIYRHTSEKDRETETELCPNVSKVTSAENYAIVQKDVQYAGEKSFQKGGILPELSQERLPFGVPMNTSQSLHLPMNTSQSLCDEEDLCSLKPSCNLTELGDSSCNMTQSSETSGNVTQPDETSRNVIQPGETSRNMTQHGETSHNVIQPDETSRNETQPGETSHNVTQPGETSRNVIQPGETSRNVTQHGETSHNVIQPDETSRNETHLAKPETSRNVTQPDETSRNVIQPGEISRNVTQPDETSPNVTQPGETSRNVIQSDETSGNVTQPGETSCNETQPDETSRNVTQPGETSRNVIQPGEISRNVTQPGETSRNVTQSGETCCNVTQPGETSCNVTQTDETSCNVTQTDETSCNVTQPAETSCNVTQPGETSCNVTQPDETSRNVTQPDETSHNVTQPDETSRNVTQPGETSRNVTQPDETSCNLTEPGAQTEMPYQCRFCWQSFQAESDCRCHVLHHVKSQYCENKQEWFDTNIRPSLEVFIPKKKEEPIPGEVIDISALKELLIPEVVALLGPPLCQTKPYRCLQCSSKDFRPLNRFLSHMSSGHGLIRIDKPWRCRWCPEQFMTREASKKEVCVWKKQACTFACHKCDKKFDSYNNVAQHRLKVHHGKRFMCSVCGQQYYTREHLSEHIHRHHYKARPFQCRYCPKKWATENHRQTHESVIHFKKGFRCAIYVEFKYTTYPGILRRTVIAGITLVKGAHIEQRSCSF
ncbi:uncharacterized protein [Amphiura filiformis]|uniref:uncharacterized protein n=1 Tax=Amphiura filiformis TaxID=82378 RepID=UPI003B219FBF